MFGKLNHIHKIAKSYFPFVYHAVLNIRLNIPKTVYFKRFILWKWKRYQKQKCCVQKIKKFLRYASGEMTFSSKIWRCSLLSLECPPCICATLKRCCHSQRYESVIRCRKWINLFYFYMCEEIIFSVLNLWWKYRAKISRIRKTNQLSFIHS